jgi:hypothetical protein
VPRWRLTIRHGPDVRTERFDELDDAIAAMRDEAVHIVGAGSAEPVTGFREYAPGEQVAARLELATGGLLRGRGAGIDVMGDGALVPYVGTLRRRRLEGRTPEQAFASVGEALR